ncbi:MAG TPA: hypothetical protein DEA08_22205 [Planctomycetes bacterium]|nr:hypothetical protein [Planctomycetota bacterium]
MSDLQKPQAAWTRLLGHELAATYLAALGELAELERRYSLERVRVLVLGDRAEVVGPGGVQLRGVALGRNTAPDGSLWLRLDAQRRVTLFSAPNGQVAVAAGPNGALAPLNGSGLSGAWDLPPAVQPVQELRLLVVPDWLGRIDAVWDGREAHDRDARRLFGDALAVVADRLRDARLALRDALREWAQLRGSAFLEQDVSELASEASTRDPSGSLTRRGSGFLPALVSAMAADSNAGPQAVARRVVIAQPAVFGTHNRGRGRLRPFSPGEACPAGRWTFRCVRGAEQGLGGREEFDCSAKIAGDDQTLSFSGLRVGFPYMGPRGFGPLLLERTPTKKGDPQDELLASAQALVVTGESSTNTDGGVLHWQLRETAPDRWAVDVHMSVARGTGDLVAQAEGVAKGAPFRATERNVSGLSLVWRLGPQPVDGASGHVDLHFFRADERPDEFVVVTEVQRDSAIQALLAAEAGAVLRSGPVPTIPDGHAHAGVLSSLLIGGLS